MAAAREEAARLSRDPSLPPALIAWTAPLFPYEQPEAARLRQAACWMSDIGSHEHPEYRADHDLRARALLRPAAFDHPTRAFIALALALRYEAETDAPFLATARALLDPAAIARAELLGVALRLAYTLSAGTHALLAGASIKLHPGRIVLRLEGAGVFAGEGVQRRLDRVAAALGVAAEVQ